MTAYVAESATYMCVYAGDDPVNADDPTGLCWPKIACGVEHSIGGAASAVAGAVVPALEQTPLPGNPFYAYDQDKSFVDNVSQRGLLYAVNQYNPLYQALEGYSNEISAVRSGCSLLADLTYGFQGAVGAASTVGVVGGGAEGVSDQISSADWNSGFLSRLTAGFGDETGAVRLGGSPGGDDFPDVNALRGADPEAVLDAIPDNWLVSSPAKGSGIRFSNPENPSQVIIFEEGWPGATDPLHSGPYLRVSTGRGPVYRIPLAGNPVLGGQP
jgi:hypothetical protein